MNLLLAILLFFVLPIVFLFVFVFTDQITEILKAFAERIRNPRDSMLETFYKHNPPHNWSSSTTTTYRRKINDGPWEDIPPEEWKEESDKAFKEVDDAFTHWRKEYYGDDKA